MATKGMKPQSSVVHGRVDNGCKSVDVKSIRSVDHWAFLEEIEAPMWVDLILEAKSAYHETDGDWFNINHPFHQRSSSKVGSQISHSGEEGRSNFSFNKERPPSPNLPRSVSKLRGKHCKSREWGHSLCEVPLKQHQVNKLKSQSPTMNPRAAKKGISVTRTGNSAGFEQTKSFSDCESKGSSTVEAASLSCNSLSGSGDLDPNFCSRSTVTSVGSEHQKKLSLEVCNQIYGRSSALLSSLKTINLRKSCCTRQASRVEVNIGRVSEGHKFSSGKSSVISSSHTGCDSDDQGIGDAQTAEKTRESRNVVRTSRTAKSKLKSANISKAPSVLIGNIRPSSRLQTSIIALKETAKEKAHKQITCPKILTPKSVNEQNHFPSRKKIEKELGWHSNSAENRKGDASQTVASSWKSINREKAAGLIGKVQKTSHLGLSERIGRRKPVGSKVEVTSQSQAKKPGNAIKKVYFRVSFPSPFSIVCCLRSCCRICSVTGRDAAPCFCSWTEERP